MTLRGSALISKLKSEDRKTEKGKICFRCNKDRKLEDYYKKHPYCIYCRRVYGVRYRLSRGNGGLQNLW